MAKPPSLSQDAAPVAREVHRRMVELGLSQKALSTSAGLNETYVRDLYKGKSRNPTTDKLSALAMALGCRIEDLTHPRRPGRDEHRGQGPNHLSELAIIQMWRTLSPSGKEAAIMALAKLLRNPASNVLNPPDDVKTDNSG